MAELREMLEERGLYTVGLKSVLVDRLIQWDEYYEQQLQLVGSKNENELRAELASYRLSTEGTKPILVRRLVKLNNERDRQLAVQRSLFGISNNNVAAPKMAETPGAEPGPSSSNAVSTPLHQQHKTSDNTGASAAPAAESENSELAQVVEQQQPQEQSQSPAKRARSASLEDFTAHQLLTDVRNSGLFSDEDILKEMSRRDDEIKRMGMIIEKKNKIIKLQNDMINTILGD